MYRWPQGEKGDTGAAGRDGVDGKDGTDGKDGASGAAGQTPYIGENGNWWIGSEDTGINDLSKNKEEEYENYDAIIIIGEDYLTFN